MGVGVQRHAPAALHPGKTWYSLLGGWVGPRAGLDGCGKSRRTGLRFPDHPARSYLGPNVMDFALFITCINDN